MSRQILRWQLLFTEYDIVYMTKKAVKGCIIANHLANNVVEDYAPLYFDLSNKDILVTKDDGKKNG